MKRNLKITNQDLKYQYIRLDSLNNDLIINKDIFNKKVKVLFNIFRLNLHYIN